jgi:hypothetical protein
MALPFAALYSSIQHAHELDKTCDWFVIYFDRDEAPEGQCTIVTAGHGALKGKRVVRGREDECARYYAGDNASRLGTTPSSALSDD